MVLKSRFTVIFLIVFTDLLGFGLILPLLPYYAKTFRAQPGVVGLLVASYAVMQLIGSPILSGLSDRYGRRPLLLLSIFGTFIGYLLLGFANSLFLLFAARIIDGLTGGNISIAQAYISDITDTNNRAKGLGLIGAAFGLGFIIGPATGGMLSVYGYSVPAFTAALLSLLNTFGVFFLLPESLKVRRNALFSSKPNGIFVVSTLLQTLKRPIVGQLLYIRFFYGLSFVTFESVFSLFAQYHLGLPAHTTGYILAYVGVIIVLVQGVAIGWLTSRISEKTLVFASTFVIALSLIAWAFAPNVLILLIAILPLASGGSVLNTVLKSLISKSVQPDEVGGMLGLAISIDSLTRVIAPSIGGFLLQNLSTSAPGVFGAFVLFALLPFIWRLLNR